MVLQLKKRRTKNLIMRRRKEKVIPRVSVLATLDERTESLETQGGGGGKWGESS